MLRTLSKKSLLLIAVTSIMTLLFAMPVLANTTLSGPVLENGTGRNLGTCTIQFLDGCNIPWNVATEGNATIDVALNVHVTEFEVIVYNGYANINLIGTYSGFEPTPIWANQLTKERDDHSLYITDYKITPSVIADSSVIDGAITSLNTTAIPSSYIGRFMKFTINCNDINVFERNSDNRYPVNAAGELVTHENGSWGYTHDGNRVGCTFSDIQLADSGAGNVTGFLSLNTGVSSSSCSSSSNSESHDDDDDDDEPAPSSSSQDAWRPAPAAAAATQQQTATTQLSNVQSSIAALSVIPTASKAAIKTTGLSLNMTSVNTIDANTSKIIAANSDIPYNVTFMFMGKPMICTVPAGFNYSQYIKPDGTMNIHEVLWAVYSNQLRQQQTRSRARTTRGRR